MSCDTSKVPLGFDCVENILSGSGGSFHLKTEINFTMTFAQSPKLFAPIVQAKFNKDGEYFTLETFFFIRIPLKNGEPQKDIQFDVFMKEDWLGTSYTPEFLIQYNLDKELLKSKGLTFSKEFYCYQYTLMIPITNLRMRPEFITTYIWDSDPEGSRGTVTTVQSGTSTT